MVDDQTLYARYKENNNLTITLNGFPLFDENGNLMAELTLSGSKITVKLQDKGEKTEKDAEKIATFIVSLPNIKIIEFTNVGKPGMFKGKTGRQIFANKIQTKFKQQEATFTFKSVD